MSETSKTLAVERSHGDFDPVSLAHVIYGDEKYYKRLMDAFAWIHKELVPMKPRPFEMSEEENRRATMAQIRRLLEFKRETSEETFDAIRHALLIYDRTTSMRMYVHVTLFCETLRTQGTKEQVSEWLPKAERGDIFGCFAMTELCHSSFLRGIETEASYDSTTDEFVIRSEGIGATKWWIGGSGQTATHTVALARLKGTGNTVWFVVELRDPKTGELRQGVEAGHLGPKAGRDGLDSGWIRFSDVRVPSSRLLSRFLSRNADGSYSAIPNTQHLSYNTLIGERLQALSEAASSAAQASIIATRYALVRRQGPNNPQIIDFKVQYTTLLPILATSLIVTATHTTLFPQWNALVLGGQTSPDLVSDWHSTAASLKALWTWWSMNSIELARRSLGGHAFSSFNAVSGIWRDTGVLTTGGGDNYVLAQQCSSFIIKHYVAHKRAKASPFPPSLSYLSSASSLKTFGLDWPFETLTLSSCSHSERRQLITQLIKAYRATIVFLLETLILSYSSHQNWNECMNELIQLSNLHGQQLTLELMLEKLDSADSSVQPIFVDTLLLHALHHCLSDQGSLFLEHNVFTSSQFSQLKKQFYALAKRMRKNAALICDVFSLPDFVIKAPLGKYDGNIYEPYFEMVKRVNVDKVAPYWQQEMAPLYKASFAKL